MSDLFWLDKDYTVDKVTLHTNKKTLQQIDDEHAQSMGYKDCDDMHTINNKKHRDMKLRFGSLYLNKEV